MFIEQLMNQLGADAAAVLLYDAEHQELTFAAERGFRSSRIRKVTVRSGQSLAGTSSRVATYGRALSFTGAIFVQGRI